MVTKTATVPSEIYNRKTGDVVKTFVSFDAAERGLARMSRAASLDLRVRETSVGKTNGKAKLPPLDYGECKHGSRDKATCLQCKAEAMKTASGPDQAASRGDIEKPIADLGALVVKAAAHVDKLRLEGNLIAMVKTMARVKVLIEQVKKVAEQANELYDRIRMRELPSIMEDQDVTNVRVEGVGLVYLADDLQVTQLDKDAIIQWLTDNHFEDLIKETVNAQTFGAWVKSRMQLKDVKEEDRYPKDLLKIRPFTRAAIRAGG